MSDHLPLQNYVFRLTRAKAGSNHLLLFNLRGLFAHSITINLSANLCLEPLLLHLPLVQLVVLLVHVVLDAIEVVLEHLRVEVLLTGDLGLVAREGIFPRLLFHRVVILDYAGVLARLDVATIVEGLHDRM